MENIGKVSPQLKGQIVARLFALLQRSEGDSEEVGGGRADMQLTLSLSRTRAACG